LATSIVLSLFCSELTCVKIFWEEKTDLERFVTENA
jgi:hypothetical protein